MKQFLLLLFLIVNTQFAFSQINDSYIRKGTYTLEMLEKEIMYVGRTYDDRIQMLGDSTHFVFIIDDENGYFRDILIYNYAYNVSSHTPVYWSELNIPILERYSKKRRKVVNIINRKGEYYQIDMNDNSNIIVKYKMYNGKTLFEFEDTGSEKFLSGYRGIYKPMAEICDH